MSTTESNNDTTDKDAASSSSSEHFPYLFELIQQKKWRKLRKEIANPQGKALVEERDSSNLTCLALALAQAAPLKVVEDMYYVDPTLLDAVDEYGATALHVGCLNGVSLESIQFILSKKPELVTVLDFDNRSALHHSVEFICNDGKINDPGNIEILTILCDAAPEMINVQDNDGGTPIDLVQVLKIKSKVDTEHYQHLDSIYIFLRGVSVKVYKENKRFWEEEGARKRALDPNSCVDDFDLTSASSSLPSNYTADMMNLSMMGDDC